jgi:hypothetical protein
VKFLSSRATLVDIGCGCECALGGHVQVAVNITVDGLRAVKVSLSYLNRGNLAGIQQVNKFGCTFAGK